METISLTVGGTAQLKLKSLATAGYVWNYQTDDSTVVNISTENNPGAASSSAGQSLDEVFTVTGIKPGIAHITFRQHRSWQKGDPVSIEEYTVEVK